MWCQLTDILMSMHGSISNVLEENGVNVFLKGPRMILLFWNNHLIWWINVRGPKIQLRLILGRENTKFLYFTGVISHSFSHQQNNLPFISIARQGPRKAFVSVGKVHLTPPSGGNFPWKCCSFFPHALKHMPENTPMCMCYMYACMLACFICLCAEQTPHRVSLVSCVMMMKGTCCSQQKLLPFLH